MYAIRSYYGHSPLSLPGYAPIASFSNHIINPVSTPESREDLILQTLQTHPDGIGFNQLQEETQMTRSYNFV